MHQIPMTIKTAQLIPRPRIEYRPMGQHGPAFIRHMDDVLVAFEALLIFYGSIGLLPALLMIVWAHEKVGRHVFEAVEGLGVKKVERVLWRGKMTVHADRYEALTVVDVGGGSPGIIGETDFVAG